MCVQYSSLYVTCSNPRQVHLDVRRVKKPHFLSRACLVLVPGGSEAIRAGRPAVRRVPGNSLRRQVCTVLLRQRDLPPVLLRVLLGGHPLPRRTRVSQAPGEGGRRSAPAHLLPLELRAPQATDRQAGRGNSERAGSAGVANQCTNKCTFLLLVPFCS